MAIGRIGIFGRGNVGSALARGAVRAGYVVRSVGREPLRIRDTSEWAELAILSVPFDAVAEVIEHARSGLLGKTLVDVTNPAPAQLQQLSSLQTSGAEELQKNVPGVRVVKAFNTVYARHMDSGTAGDSAVTTFVAGDDPEARNEAMLLARRIGFHAVDAGALARARHLEPFAAVNIPYTYALKIGPPGAFE